jgi:hypothetical protein
MALLLSSSCRLPCSPLVIRLSRCLSKIRKYKHWKKNNGGVYRKAKTVRFLSQAFSHSYNPLPKIPQNQYKTHKH